MHVHSMYSLNCKMDISEIQKRAMKENLEAVSITDYVGVKQGLIQTTYLFSESSTRTKEIRRLNKLKEKVLLLNGIEISSPYLVKGALDFYKELPLDIILGTIHDINKNCELETDILNAYQEYYQKNLRALKETNFDVLSHLGYIDKYYDYPYENSELIDEILCTAIKKEIALEINSSSKRTFPSYELLKRYKELGGEKVTIGSNAHHYDQIGTNLDISYEIAKELNLEVGYFQKRKFKKII